MATLLLVDGHSQAYRAYFGVKSQLSTRAGEPTTAVFGFVRKFLSVLKEYKPEQAAVAFDTGDTWRHAEFAAYKATRDAMPDDMRGQIERIQQFLTAFNVPVVTYDNYEADDILGTLARQAADAGTDVFILTGDRDMFQLISDRIRILYTKGGPNPETVIFGKTELQARYGLTAEQFVDFKALIGDSSDNIPGVSGVGEKTAGKYLNDYGSIANLYAHIDEVTGPKARQSLIDAREQVERNRRIMSIVTDLNLNYDAEACRLSGYDQQAVQQFFNELEFRSFAKDLPPADPQATAAAPTPATTETGATRGSEQGQLALFGEAETPVELPPPTTPAGVTYGCVQTQAELDAVVAALGSAKLLSFDVETTSTDAMQATLVGLGIAWDIGQAAYIPVGHGSGDQLPWAQVIQVLQPFFADPKLPKVAHNAKYDMTVCRRHGLETIGPIHDTMVMAWILDPASRALGLKAQATELLGWQMTEITDLIGSGRKQITIDAVPIEHVGPYCGADVDATLRLYAILSAKLHEQGLWNLYATLEVPLLPVLMDMEMAGVLLDIPFLGEMSKRFGDRLAELELELFKLVGHEFNLRSTQQLSQVLFDELQFPTKGMKRTASGHFSTAVQVFDQLAAMREELTEQQLRVLVIMREQRQLEKLRGTYIDALPQLVNPQTGRVHTSFNQTGAVTGRMSSSNPNLQNIPIRTEVGREIRRAFIAPPGWQIISADYSQVELRILAHVTGEPVLVEAFQSDQDIHTATASLLFDVPIAEVTKDQRGLAKTINYATIYGISEFGLSIRTEMSRKEARHFLDQYFVTYPRIRDYIGATIRQANEVGYVETLLGRKRFFPELLNSRLPYNQRQAVERAAINAPIQGTSADIMKIAMIRLHTRLRDEGLQARMLLQVHDELVLETPEAECARVAQVVCEVMENAYELSVPLGVEIEYGPNWYNLEPAVVTRA